MPALTPLPPAADRDCMFWVYFIGGIALWVPPIWILIAKDQGPWLLSIVVLGPLALIPALLLDAKPGSKWRRRFGDEQGLPEPVADQPAAGGPTFTR